MVKGFSLIELMVVIAIVAILSAVAAPLYNGLLRNFKVGSTVPVVAGLANQVQVYYEQKGVFPTTAAQLGVANNNTTTIPLDIPITVSDYPAPYLFIYGFEGNYDSGTCPNFSVFSYISNVDNSMPITASVSPGTPGANFIDTNEIYFLTGSGVWQRVCIFIDFNGVTESLDSSSTAFPDCFNNADPSQNAAAVAATAALLNSCP